jgi:hypothetical protein
MTYFEDPWILPSPSTTMDETGHSDSTPAQELDPRLEPIWAQGSLSNIESLDLVFPSDEAVIKVMTSPDKPWEYLHHISYFLPELS